MLDGLNPRRLRESRTPVLLPLGINLPFHVVRGTLDTGQTIDIRRKRFQVGIPMGSFGHFIYRVRRGPLYEAARPDPRSPILDDIRLRPDRVLRPTPRPTIG
jgi:hypothetical protein